MPISDLCNQKCSAGKIGDSPITRSIGTSLHERAAQLLKQSRIEAGLTQAQLALRLQRPQSFIADVEKGQRRVDLVEFVNFARAVGFDPHLFLDSLLMDQEGG
ncbi:helix-turn-helix domain-containing protein [Sphingomonas sp. MMS24-J45]|uniref:helix-turn-helix domain-containing protein n=1 Tax=Sphingomonas sp. MMS24-J45 TaxID=3238806 RepID=UPI00384E41D4